MSCVWYIPDRLCVVEISERHPAPVRIVREVEPLGSGGWGACKGEGLWSPGSSDDAPSWASVPRLLGQHPWVSGLPAHLSVCREFLGSQPACHGWQGEVFLSKVVVLVPSISAANKWVGHFCLFELTYPFSDIVMVHQRVVFSSHIVLDMIW